jgi:uncharacterized PurR-regulated membrane protein YhhQ (DUF165 family)
VASAAAFAGSITQDKKMSSARVPFSGLAPFIMMMAGVVALSNYLVQFPFLHFGLGDLLTWGAFTYPVAFLVNDLTNRRFGVAAARRVVMVGFLLAVILSAWLATPRIALASGTAFLAAQLVDASIFDRLRREAWWHAPLISSVIGSLLDTLLFFGIAFSASFAFIDGWTGQPDGSLADPVAYFGTEVPLWASLAVGDLCVKLAVAAVMLVPYGLLFAPALPAESA